MAVGKTTAGSPTVALDAPTSDAPVVVPKPAAKPAASGWGSVGEVAAVSDGYVAPLHAPIPTAAVAPQRIELGAVKLNPDTPFEVPGIDPRRPIAYVEALTLDHKPVTVRVGTEAQQTQAYGSAARPGFVKPLFGDVLLTGEGKVTAVKVHYADIEASNVDYFSINIAKQGLRDGQALVLPFAPEREGREIQNIGVSFHAPVRTWNTATGREEQPTYSDWYVDDRHLQRKFIDPNYDNGNAPEVDNVYPQNSSDTGSLGTAGKTLRIVADSKKIPSTEQAMTVQWVKVTYKATNTEVKTQSFKGEPLPNNEWKGKWISSGQALQLDLEPGREVERVEIQWSDKPDDYGYETPGKWAVGTLLIDGKVVGQPREHVGSPAWQVFEGGGVKGQTMELQADDSDLKIFQVKVHYKK